MDVDTDTSLSPPPQHLVTRRLTRKRISVNALAQAQSYSPDPLLAISPALQPRFFFGPESSPSSPSMPVPAAVGLWREDATLGSSEQDAILRSTVPAEESSVDASLKSLSIQAEYICERPSSTDTVLGPTTAPRDLTPPLTPFPPLMNESEDEWQPPEWRDLSQGTCLMPSRRRGSTRYTPFAILEVETRWLLSSILHGIVLALQFSVALAVFSALLSVAVWKKPDADVQFWDWLWNFAEPTLVAVLILCSGTLVAHEAKILSAVALLYLQCAILMVTTAASFIMWARCIEETSRPVKAVLMGCNVLMWGLAFSGFVRAAVVWKIEACVEERRGRASAYGQTLAYGTFAPWSEAARGR
ncbi:hypothetical protein EDB81DRAFT_896551 [Dactylonectria macrodidyma]|uniref:Uncharacterized protein n=1 Tax=Dactylonectria macrodidyma TaxID=307937 RepID=A0A9P9FSH3_9HYPO|nr:hypothetical protein EDB81DRAFT_896551 [Dactylonectria macrodidyma]